MMRSIKDSKFWLRLVKVPAVAAVWGFFQRPIIRHATPLYLILGMVIVTWSEARAFAEKYRPDKQSRITREDLRKLGCELADDGIDSDLFLQKQYEKYCATRDINQWQNKRAPRPWEPDVAADQSFIAEYDDSRF